MYFFWKLVADPPAPFQRLTRTNQYLRFNATPGNHWTEVGAETHLHAISGYSCGNGSPTRPSQPSGLTSMAQHTHPEPASWTVPTNTNNPPAYGLDIIYVDLDTWENTLRYFPEGSVLVSNGALVDAELTRFSAADGKYIIQAEPGTTSGTDTPQSHTVTGTTGSSGTSSTSNSTSAFGLTTPSAHTHAISLTSDAKYSEPRNLVTRLYEATVQTSKALAGIVVFVDGTPGGNWEILTSWAGGSLKSGDSDPTLSGSDNHTQSISGNCAAASLTDNRNYYDYVSCPQYNHVHSISATLASAEHIPSSRLIIPARLLNTLPASKPANRVQIIGL